jgi:hypothetical protein
MTTIWYDTEFIEDGRTIDLISIGMVRDDGREYYAVNAAVGLLHADSDDDLHKRICNSRWLMDHVVPNLPVRGKIDPLGLGGAHPSFTLDTRSTLVRPRWVIANEVRDFVQSSPVLPVTLKGWYSDYDHVLLSQLYGRMIDRPEHFPMWTYDLKQECERLGNPAVPEQSTTEHHALGDAKHARQIDEFLQMIERQQTGQEQA